MTIALADTDLALLSRYAATRDTDAFAELARRYAGMVVAAARRITGSPHDAEDIAQSAFLELAKNANAVKTSIPGYLHRIATTRALNLLRDNATRRRHESELAERTRDITAHELLPLIDAAIEQLPDDLRVPLVLHYLQGRSQPEIARTLNLSQPTISRRIESAIAKLRTTLHLNAALGATGLLTQTLTQAAPQSASPQLLASLNKLALSGFGPAAQAAKSIPLLLKIVLASFLLISLGSLLTYHLADPPASTPIAAGPPVAANASVVAASAPATTSQPAVTLTDEQNLQRGAHARDLSMAIITYATNRKGNLPTDLGVTLRSVQQGRTIAEKAATFISPADPNNPQIPEFPDRDWINANTSFVYLGNNTIKMRSSNRKWEIGSIKNWSDIAIVHEKFDFAIDGKIAVGFLDAHAEMMNKDFAQKVIDDSKKALQEAAEKSDTP